MLGGTSDLVQELDQQTIHVGRALLLNPMPRTREQNLLRQVRRVDFERLVGVGVKFDHRVLVAGDEQCRLSQLSTVEEPAHVPDPIDVAIPVEAAAKAGALELGGEKVKVRL